MAEWKAGFSFAIVHLVFTNKIWLLKWIYGGGHISCIYFFDSNSIDWNLSHISQSVCWMCCWLAHSFESWISVLGCTCIWPIISEFPSGFVSELANQLLLTSGVSMVILHVLYEFKGIVHHMCHALDDRWPLKHVVLLDKDWYVSYCIRIY